MIVFLSNKNTNIWTEIQKPMTEKDFIQQQDMELYEYTKQKLGLWFYKVDIVASI